MKKLLLIVSALALTICANAQLLKESVPVRNLIKAPTFVGKSQAKAPARANQSAVTASAGQLWWGYFTESDADNLDYGGYLGLSGASTIITGLGVSGSNPIVGGAKIVAVRFWLGDDISKINSNLTIWISKTLPNEVSLATYKQTVPKSSLKKRLNEIELTTPYDVNNGDFYIGYALSISAASYPIMGGGEEKEGGWYYHYTGSSWINFYGEDYGNLAFQMLLDGVSLAENSAVPSDFGTNYVVKGQTVAVPVTITNFGEKPITSITYSITGGNGVEENTISVNNLAFNNSVKVNVIFPADDQAKRYDKQLTITKVNGAPNESEQKTANGSLITITERPVATPVVEEFTGTWCGWCPRGWDGMEKTQEKYGDKVVLIAVHAGDPMECSDYKPIANTVSGYPSCYVDREWDIDPNASSLDYVVKQQLERVTVGAISAKAQWASDAKTAIKISTGTRFVYDDENGDYGIALVLLEDGMTGTGSDWAQANYLSGRSGYESISFWYNSPASVSGLEFNHVPVAAWSIANGISSSVKSNIVAGETQTFNYEANITGNSLIQDKTKLAVVALLIDRSNSTIVNAVQVAIDDAGAATGVAVDATNFPDDNFRAWLLNSENINGYGADALLTDDEIANIKEIDIWSNDIADLKGIEYFTALESLVAGSNKLTSVDFSKNTALKVLNLWMNQLTAIDVSKNTALINLEIGSNNLTAIDVSKNTALINLEIGSNNLTAIDVSKNTALEVLNISQNKLTSIDLSQNVRLTNLYFYSNQITSIDLSKNTALTLLDAGINALTSIDVSTNTALVFFYCDQNQLTSVDVSMLPNLSYFSCYENQMSTLDVSKNTALEQLRCNDNQLTVLDISANTALFGLEIYNNNINETEMGKIVECLPIVTPSSDRENGFFRVIDKTVEDKNVINTEQVAAAKAKNWLVQAFIGIVDGSRTYEDYEGTAPDGINTLIAQPSLNQPIFNVSGQQQSELRRGINIIGGKKVLVK